MHEKLSSFFPFVSTNRKRGYDNNDLAGWLTCMRLTLSLPDLILLFYERDCVAIFLVLVLCKVAVQFWSTCVAATIAPDRQEAVRNFSLHRPDNSPAPPALIVLHGRVWKRLWLEIFHFRCRSFTRRTKFHQKRGIPTTSTPNGAFIPSKNC